MNPAITTRQRKWKKCVEDCLSSGLSQVDYCQRNRIKPSHFYAWKHRLKQLGLLDHKPVKHGEFLPVVISHDAEPLPYTPAIVLKIGQVDIVMTHETDENLLLRALTILEARA